jgi:hypothetical protein
MPGNGRGLETPGSGMAALAAAIVTVILVNGLFRARAA